MADSIVIGGSLVRPPVPAGGRYVLVVGLDDSTTKTGASIIIGSKSAPYVIEVTSFVPVDESDAANTVTERLRRIASIKRQWEEWAKAKIPEGLIRAGHPRENVEVIIAYEFHTGRNTETSEALSMTAGSLLTIDCVIGYRIERITPSQAKDAWGGGGLERADAKRGVVLWANREFGLGLAPSQHDEADGVAVGVAGWARWRAGLTGQSALDFSPPRRRTTRRLNR